VINWIVVGQTKLIILATVDGQFIKLTTQLSTARSTRRDGLLATADILVN